MNLPSRYAQFRAGLTVDNIGCGCGGIMLFPTAELEQNQVGYSVTPDGVSLCTGEAGAWESSWIVIGCETACGDPIFIDSADAQLPVFTAIHGEGDWEPELVATTIDAFAQSLVEFARIAKGRSNPVELEESPIPDKERTAFLTRVKQLNQGRIDPDFWALLIES